MDNQTTVSIKFTNNVTGQKKLEEYAETLKMINSFLSSIDIGKSSALEQAAKNTNNISSNETKDNMKDISKNLKDIFGTSKIIAFSKVFGKVVKDISTFTRKSANYIENWNLLDVSFQNNTVSAEKFVNTLSEMYGLDESWGYRTVGIFKQLANAMGLTEEVGTQLSKVLTQLAIDTSSLYNIDIEDTVSILQSALAGQTKPVRRLGGDITQSTLQLTLDTYGIDRGIESLSYAEKRLVIVTAMLNQTDEAWGDWGRTIESVSNQMRIFQQQVERLTRAIGNVFLPVLKAIIPYLNAILMVLVEIINWLALLVGYDESEFDFFDETNKSVLDLASNLGTASDNAKKLQSGLRSFDKLNVIKTPSSSKSGSGTGIGTIDPKVLEMFNKASNNYLDNLDKVQMKATVIRDTIMEWLGFTKLVDSTTGKVSFKLKEGYSNFKLIVGILGTIVGLKLLNKLKGLITGTSTLGKLLGTGGLYKALKKLIEPIKVLGAKDGLKYIFLEGLSAAKKYLPILGKVALGLGGVASAIYGSKGVYNAMKTMTKQQEKSSKEMKNYYKNIGLTTAGATALGFALGGPLGAGIGAVSGLAVSATAGIIGLKKGIKELAEEDLFGTLNISTEEWVNILNSSSEPMENFKTQLDDIKTKTESYYEVFETNAEKLDLFGYRFSVLGQQISEEDAPKIYNAIKKMAEESANIIDTNTQYYVDYWTKSFSQMTTLTKDEQQEVINTITNYGESQKKELSTAQDNITKTYKNAIKTRGYLTDKEREYIQEQLTKIRTLTQAEMSKNQANIEYYKKISADKNIKLDKESYANFNKALDQYQKERQTKIEDNYTTALNNAKIYYETMGGNEETYNKMLSNALTTRLEEEKKLNGEIKKYRNSVYDNLADTYSKIKDKTDEFSKDQKKSIESIFKDIDIDSSEITKKFGTLGKKVGETCALEIKKAVNDSRLKIKMDTSSMGGKNYEIPFTAYISKRANGGLPPVGQLFVANEKGPELVSQIGGQSFVANQNQMMQLLDKKIGNAKTGLNSATFIIQVGDEEIARKVLNNLQDMAISNGEPITIGA